MYVSSMIVVCTKRVTLRRTDQESVVTISDKEILDACSRRNILEIVVLLKSYFNLFVPEVIRSKSMLCKIF